MSQHDVSVLSHTVIWANDWKLLTVHDLGNDIATMNHWSIPNLWNGGQFQFVTVSHYFFNRIKLQKRKQFDFKCMWCPRFYGKKQIWVSIRWRIEGVIYLSNKSVIFVVIRRQFIQSYRQKNVGVIKIRVLQILPNHYKYWYLYNVQVHSVYSNVQDFIAQISEKTKVLGEFL